MLLIAGLMWLFNKYAPIVTINTSLWHQFGYVFIATGLLIDLSAVVQFFREHTTINPLNPEKTGQLVSSGLYQYSRNPMYVGLLLLLIGWLFLLGSLSPIILLPAFILILNRQQILPEEKVLEQKFGQQYKDYRHVVRRWL